MRTHSSALIIFAALATFACASGSADTEQRPPRPERRDSYVITEKELGASTARNVLEAVQRLRPQWLRSRGATSVGRGAPDAVMIYLNDVRLGGPAALAQLSTDGVKEVRYFNATDATSRWGTDHTAGAIVVTLK